MDEVTEEEAQRLAARRGWPMDAERIRAVLPELRRLLEAAARLRELPMDPADPPDSVA